MPAGRNSKKNHSTILTNRFGTTITVLMVFPSINARTFSDANAAAWNFFLGRSGRHGNDIAQFAVDLDRNLNRFLRQQAGQTSATVRSQRPKRRRAWRAIPQPDGREGLKQNQEITHDGRGLRLQNSVVDQRSSRRKWPVLKRKPSRSSVTFLMQAWSVFNCAAVAGTFLIELAKLDGRQGCQDRPLPWAFAFCSNSVSLFSSTNKRQTRPKKR